MKTNTNEQQLVIMKKPQAIAWGFSFKIISGLRPV